MSNEVSVRDAAARLSVNQSRVRELLTSGRLTGRRVGAVWLVSERALDQRLETSAAARGRPLSLRTAWSATALLDGMATPWLATSERSRLRNRLSHHDARDVQTYRWWLQSRAVMTRYRVAESDIAELLSSPDVVAGGISAAGSYNLGLGHGAEGEIYVDAVTARRLVDEFFLIESDRGNLAVHVVDSLKPWHQTTARTRDGMLVTPRLIVAADLLDSDDARSRSAGARLLAATVTTPVDDGLLVAS